MILTNEPDARPRSPLAPEPESPPSPPSRRNPATVAVLVLLAVAVVLLLALLVRHPAASPGPAPVAYVSWYGHPGVVVVDRPAYIEFLRSTVQPSLVSIGVTIQQSACTALAAPQASSSAPQGNATDDAMVQLASSLRAAHLTAQAALDASLSIQPPSDLRAFHDSVVATFREASGATDALAACATSGGTGQACAGAQQQTQQLVADIGGLVANSAQVDADASVHV